MDTSKEYIKMCEKAREIQELWFRENGNFVFWKATNSIKIITDTFNTDDLKIFIWLPRQDQLQDMVIEKWKKGIKEGNSYRGYPISFIEDFNQFIRCQIAQKYNCVNWSMEQLWLAFVMENLYNKTWNGEGWIK